MRYSYEIVPRAPELGGGWNLRLLDGDTEVGGGVFPLPHDAAAAADWWHELRENQREWWLERAVERGAVPSVREAYMSYLLAEAHADAEATAYDWLDSRE